MVGLFVLTGYEARNGVRLFGPQRRSLDAWVERVAFVLTHVDFKSFLQDLVRRLAQRVAHDVAHFSLLAVRATERFLTRIVRHLRTESTASVQPKESTREFVKTLSDFKDQLKATPPEVPDVLH